MTKHAHATDRDVEAAYRALRRIPERQNRPLLRVAHVVAGRHAWGDYPSGTPGARVLRCRCGATMTTSVYGTYC